MSYSRFAVFYQPLKSRKWGVCCQVRIARILWLDCYVSHFDTEDDAMHYWHAEIQRELDKRAPTGERRTEWKP